MYAHLSGVLKKSSSHQVVLDVGGVGYRVEIPLSLYTKLPSVGSPLTLYVSFVVREFSHAFFGFSQEEERDLFEILIELSGVGPKLALSLLGHLEPAQLYQVVLQQDLDTLAKVPGIGKKKGERILVELKGKLPEKHPSVSDYSIPLSGHALVSDATRALIHLGYPHATASRAVQKGLSSLPKETALSDLITEALKYAQG